MRLENIYKNGLFARGKICDDCYGFLGSGDKSGVSSEWGEAEFDSTMQKFDIVLSEIHTGEFGHDCSHAGTSCEDDCDCTISAESKAPCSCCKNPYSGRRHDVLFIRKTLYGRGNK